MKILRLTNSTDRWEGVPAEHRTPERLRCALCEQTGEDAEFVIRMMWPTPRLPDLIDGWIEEHRPDVVFLWVNPYWFAYPSVPLLVERMLGRRVGRPLDRATRRVANVPWVAYNPLFRKIRDSGRRLIGAAYEFEPEQVVQTMDLCVRRIVRHEEIVLAVWGPPFCFFHEPDKAERQRGDRRRRLVNAGLRRLCEELHVLCEAPDERPDIGDGRRFIDVDGMHPNTLGYEWFAERQLAIHLEAWRQLREEAPVPSPTQPA